MNSKEILDQLTLEEKASLCSGKDFWNLKSIKRLGLQSIMVTDGPHGLRKQEGDADHLGISKSVKATCFPTASATANSWDTDLMFKMGEALGEECLQEDVSVILGPGVNIKRSPLCGRNFEYISEDPIHSGKMAASLIKGVQSKGIGTSLKHFALNNQETRRMTINTLVDERAKREIYLKGFEIAVKEAQPWTVMCSYNRVDGSYLSDHKILLNDILKEEWGHRGIVVTDWGACNNRVEGIKAGLELEMPSSYGKNDERIIKAIEDKSLDEAMLDKAAIRIIDLIIKSQKNKIPEYKYDLNKHHELAIKIARESIVLLKNHDILPLDKEESIAIIGEFAKKPRYQGSGSSIINPSKLDNICQILDQREIAYKYSKGYSKKTPTIDEKLISDAVIIAKDSKVAILFIGLTDDYESEGFDRTHLELPKSHIELVKRVKEVNSNTVVVLHNGAPVEIPFVDDVKAILECYLSGQGGASATIDILFGDFNPCAKLSETFPVALKDNPSYNYFPGNTATVLYNESIYVGYRYYDKANKDVLFPFGHGLSYTKYKYSNLVLKKEKDFDFTISLNVKNVGLMDGSEIVQLYIKNNESKIFKAVKELKSFKKVFLKANEEKRITFNICKNDFAYYNTNISNWHVDSGDYKLLIGASSRDIRLEEKVEIIIIDDIKVPDYRKTAADYYMLKNDVFSIDDSQFEVLYNKAFPAKDIIKGSPFTHSSSMLEVKEKFIGKIVYKMIIKNIKKMYSAEDVEAEIGNVAMVESIVKEMPIRALDMAGDDKLPKYLVEGLVLILNNKIIKGIKMILKK